MQISSEITLNQILIKYMNDEIDTSANLYLKWLILWSKIKFKKTKLNRWKFLSKIPSMHY